MGGGCSCGSGCGCGIEAEKHFVTQYNLLDGTETVLTPTNHPREQPACGAYKDAGNQQVLLVTGGWWEGNFPTEVAVYSEGVELEWRETSQLPTEGRQGLRAAVIDNTLYVLGGYHNTNHVHHYITDVLRWDPSNESWQHVGDINTARGSHAVVKIPSSIIESECSS